MSHENDILYFLKCGNKITPLIALNLFNCLRLSAVIYDLRKKGYSIITENYKTPSGKYVGRYYLEK